MQSDFLSVREASEALGLTPASLRLYCRHGVFPGARKERGTQWRIPKMAIDFFDGSSVSGLFARKRKPFTFVDGCEVRAYDNTLLGIHGEEGAIAHSALLNALAEEWVKNA